MAGGGGGAPGPFGSIDPNERVSPAAAGRGVGPMGADYPVIAVDLVSLRRPRGDRVGDLAALARLS